MAKTIVEVPKFETWEDLRLGWCDKCGPELSDLGESGDDLYCRFCETLYVRRFTDD